MKAQLKVCLVCTRWQWSQSVHFKADSSRVSPCVRLCSHVHCRKRWDITLCLCVSDNMPLARCTSISCFSLAYSSWRLACLRRYACVYAAVWHVSVKMCARTMWEAGCVCLSVTIYGRKRASSACQITLPMKGNRVFKVFWAEQNPSNKRQVPIDHKTGWFCCQFQLAHPVQELGFLCAQMNCAEFEGVKGHYSIFKNANRIFEYLVGYLCM